MHALLQLMLLSMCLGRGEGGTCSCLHIPRTLRHPSSAFSLAQSSSSMIMEKKIEVKTLRSASPRSENGAVDPQLALTLRNRQLSDKVPGGRDEGPPVDSNYKYCQKPRRCFGGREKHQRHNRSRQAAHSEQYGSSNTASRFPGGQAGTGLLLQFCWGGSGRHVAVLQPSGVAITSRGRGVCLPAPRTA